MSQNDSTIEMVHAHSDEKRTLPLADLTFALTDFLDHFCVAALVGQPFMDLVQRGDGSARGSRLFSACGFDNDPHGFFRELLSKLGRADGSAIVINGVALPHLLLMAVLEVALPGNRFLSIKTVEQLEEAANLQVQTSDRADMQQVIDTYPVRLSMHTIRQMRISRDVAYQYLPFVQELDDTGHTNTWIGQFHQGLLEQMYQNRVIFLINMGCPVYCRFCFRKHKESRNEANPSPADVGRAVAHVKASPAIKEIVITGGDPFMNRKNMAAAIDGLMEIEHVQTLRLATRAIAYYPHLFLADDGELLTYLKHKHLALQQRGKRMEVATHFIHPDEISPQSLMIITELVRSGIPVYVQTPFLNDCNDKGPELVRLFSLLRGAGAELHYIYIPCSPIHGNSVYWAPISKGLAAGNYLRAHLSDRVIPRICTATPIGKMDWLTSGWAVEPVEGKDNFMWIRSPYTPEYFKRFAPLANALDNVRVNAEGTIDIQYMARIGDDALFMGARPKRPGDGGTALLPTKEMPPELSAPEGLGPSIVPTGSRTLSRVHETRVELDTEFTDADLAYIRDDARITDVVLMAPTDTADGSTDVVEARTDVTDARTDMTDARTDVTDARTDVTDARTDVTDARTDVTDALFRIRRLVSALGEAPHVNALRLRSLKFAHAPQRYTPAMIDALGNLNRLTLVSPLRIEIETRFLVADELQKAHTRLTRQLNNRGITIYCNTPLLGEINDAPEVIHALAYACRQAGIEFHHLYVAGLAIQNHWNAKHPVALYDVIDIATQVRREGSGREVPRYILRTSLGEVDFGLSSRFMGQGTDLSVKLLPYDRDYFTALAPDFAWPADVLEDRDGKPIVPITGLLKQTEFALS